MNLELKFDWQWILQKVRIVFLLAVFWGVYHYMTPFLAFVWLGYFLMNDLSDIESSLSELTARQELEKEERLQTWKSMSTKRKDF
jgi:hypothetical protein